AAELGRWCDPIGYEEARRPRVLRDDPDGHVGRAIVAVRLSRERLELLDERLEEIRAVRVAGNALQNLSDALEARACVDVLFREGHERTVGLAVVLLKDEVPDLEPSPAVLGGTAVMLGDARLRAVVDEDLAVRSAKTGRAGRPEVVRIAEAEDLLARKQLQGLRPDVVGLVVARVDGRDELRAVEPEHLREQLPAPLDRFFLAVIA